MAAYFTYFKKHFPLVMLIGSWCLLVICNYVPGTWLTGWDNLHPEFNFSANISRSLQAVWQEYQGLGLLGGMGHASDLIHQLILWIFSLVLPVSFLRYFWHFLLLLTGCLGVFYLVSWLLRREVKAIAELAGLLAGLFYLLNLGTVQNFYVPFEPFSTFFGLLPWLLLTLFRWLETGQKQALGTFAFLSVLAIPIGYVQTEFIVWVILLGGITVGYLLSQRNHLERRNNVLTTWVVVGAINAFWLLPVFYFTLTGSGITVEAKGNQMSTEETILRNNAFGTLSNVMTLKGYWFEIQDYTDFGKLVYILQPWREHLNVLPIGVLGYGFFALVVIGIGVSLKHKMSWRWSLIGIFVISVVMLMGDTPPLGWLVAFLRDQVSLFGQIFRSPFTKWVVPASLAYSVFFGMGAGWVIRNVSLFPNSKARIAALNPGFLLLTACLVLYSWPVFTSNFFYKAMKQQIPQEYFQLFDFFKHQDKNTRIADLPQHSFWGWYWYDWPNSIAKGYRGSGFLWYGIEQSILSRTFDVWSREDEGYYWEIQHALNSEDPELINAVLQKYQVNWLLLDTSVVNRDGGQDFNYDQIKRILALIPNVQLDSQFNFLYVYRVKSALPAVNNISLTQDAPVIENAYTAAWTDTAYHDYGVYRLSDKQTKPLVVYPFPTLFTNRTQKELEFTVEENPHEIVIKSKPQSLPVGSAFTLSLPSMAEIERSIPVVIRSEKIAKGIKLTFEYIQPQIEFLGHKWGGSKAQEFLVTERTCLLASGQCALRINEQEYTLTLDPGSHQLGIQFLPTTYTSVVEIKNSVNGKVYQTNAITNDMLRELYTLPSEKVVLTSRSPVALHIPKLDLNKTNTLYKTQQTAAKNCREQTKGFSDKTAVDTTEGKITTYTAIGASSCDYYFFETLPHSQGYIFKIAARNLASLPLQVGIQNSAQSRSELDTRLEKNSSFTDNWLIVPPIANFNAGYSVYLDTVSFGQELARNQVKEVMVWPIPYNFITSLKLINSAQSVSQSQPMDISDYQVQKLGIWLYKIQTSNQQSSARNQTLILSQAYHPGWVGIIIQKGRWEFLPHTKVNNWTNGWELNSKVDTNTIYLFFWPQMLEYLGFGLLMGAGVWVIKQVITQQIR